MLPHLIVTLCLMGSSTAAANRRREGLSPEIFFQSVSLDFPKLKFADSECNSTKGRKGTCIGYPDCEGDNAVREGVCSDGFGTCCVYLVGTDLRKETRPTVNEWGSFYSNADFPLPTLEAESSVRIHIERDVCQIRLDFESLDLPERTVFRTIVNGDLVPPILSGNNTGQHLMINVGDGSSQGAWVSLGVSGPMGLKTWNIHITNVPCHSSTTAPVGCAQYFLAPSGRLRSLSVQSVGITSYAICLRPRNLERNLLSLRSFASGAACGSSMVVPAGISLDGRELPAMICPKDDIKLTYKVFGPLVLYMKTAPGQRGVEVQYDL
ncbi:uncharacterized protein LOC114828618 [Galendromus occidentalis]|uniref:Uncharacterized protein LOC114828618 n=1 Tax=Galendromus occidentalis TaxID=34638 RepID=A0AAJ7SJE5_9ACAR|nr:uncharacterized protein LOC114828618 [Galendromus occidentalis]